MYKTLILLDNKETFNINLRRKLEEHLLNYLPGDFYYIIIPGLTEMCINPFRDLLKLFVKLLSLLDIRLKNYDDKFMSYFKTELRAILKEHPFSYIVILKITSDSFCIKTHDMFSSLSNIITSIEEKLYGYNLIDDELLSYFIGDCYCLKRNGQYIIRGISLYDCTEAIYASLSEFGLEDD